MAPKDNFTYDRIVNKLRYTFETPSQEHERHRMEHLDEITRILHSLEFNHGVTHYEPRFDDEDVEGTLVVRGPNDYFYIEPLNKFRVKDPKDSTKKVDIWLINLDCSVIGMLMRHPYKKEFDLGQKVTATVHMSAPRDACFIRDWKDSTRPRAGNPAQTQPSKSNEDAPPAYSP